jgi:hypothetical protein
MIAMLTKEKVLPSIRLLGSFILSFCAMLILFWPTLWSNPVHNFLECYGMMSHFARWIGDLLFNGKQYKGYNLPWIYLPEWFCISTPIVWLAAGFTGTALVVLAFFKNPLAGIRNTTTRFYLVCVALYLLPVLMVIFLNSVVYDDWRHVYFIYCPFVVLAVYAFDRLLTNKMQWLVWAIWCVQVVAVGYFMIRYHPFQSVYLNEFVSREKDYIKDHLEMDYWGCSQKQGLAYIVAHDPRPMIRVAMHPALDNSIMILREKDRKRIVRVKLDEHPDYFIATYRNAHPDDHEYHNSVFEINVLNSTIMRVYKLQ